MYPFYCKMSNKMKILATSDPHYPWCRDALPKLEELIEKERPDVFVVAGDISQFDDDHYREYFETFQKFVMQKVAVLGNHDLWAEDGSSLERFKRVCGLMKERDFYPLDQQPLILDGVGFVGTIGWYDYSFANLTREDGVVELGGKVKRLRDITFDDYAAKETWNDGMHIRWGLTDEQFLNLCVKKLKQDINQVSVQADRIVAVVHHAPFENMVPYKEGDAAFLMRNAYMGSPKLGEALLSSRKVQALITGHTHFPMVKQNGHIACYNVSAPYGNISHQIINL